MLADLLYFLIPYQIFKSVFFRGGLTFLTTFFTINIVMPLVIRKFRQKGVTSDFSKAESGAGPYSGATPIMGGAIFIPVIVVSTLLWAWVNQYTISLLLFLSCFALIGGIDDMAKVLNKRKVEAGLKKKQSFSDKADGIRGEVRLGLEFVAALLIIGMSYWFFDGIDGRLHIPMIPMKVWFPWLPDMLFIPFVVLVVVGGANAVNLTDGLDSLATVPIISCSIFVAAAAYLAGDLEWSQRLKLLYISDDIKEVTIFAISLIAACVAFLRFNSPPAAIYMGDVGSLGLGAAVCSMFVFTKAELYLPIVGGGFVLAAVSVILQRIWFKLALMRKGRDWAEKNRFFYRAPYHHHQQALLTYRPNGGEINSIWYNFLKRLNFFYIPDEDKYLNSDHVNNKVIWRNHLRAVYLLVITLMIYFKVR